MSVTLVFGTLFFARREIPRVMTRTEAREEVKQHEVCRTTDPALAKWEHRSLSVTQTRWHLLIDITHHTGHA